MTVGMYIVAQMKVNIDLVFFFGDSENGFFIHNEFWCPPDYYCIENLTYPDGDCFLSCSDNDIHSYPYDGDNFPKECEK